MQNILAVFIGGGIGAVLRYITGLLFVVNFKINIPFATFAVNIAGCFILGLLYVIFIEKAEINTALKLALTVGFCGGLTTFSTFSLEIFEMIKTANFIFAFLYVILSLFLGLIAVWLGVTCAKFL